MKTTITTSARNLGYSWSNTPDRDGLIEPPDQPKVVGGLKSVEAEHYRAARINTGNFWCPRLFVGGKPVKSDPFRRVGDIIAELREFGEVEVEVVS